MRFFAALLLMAAAAEIPLVQPKDLAAALGSSSAKPVVLHVAQRDGCNLSAYGAAWCVDR